MNPIDRYVGERVRQSRINRDLTQRALAEVLCVSTQDVADYESGRKRLTAAQLFTLTKVLNCDVAYFFEGLV